MKNSHIKIIAKIEEKIAFNELLKQGQINNSIDTTPIENFIEGLKESIQVIINLKQKDVNKSILKEADKYLCLEDGQTVLSAVNTIIESFNKDGNGTLDYIDNIQVIENFEFVFCTGVFLNLIGIKCKIGDKIKLLF
jgi:hypothetical protein